MVERVIENPVAFVGCSDDWCRQDVAEIIEARRLAAERGELEGAEDMSRARAYNAAGAFVGYVEDEGDLAALSELWGGLCVQTVKPMEFLVARLPFVLKVGKEGLL